MNGGEGLLSIDLENDKDFQLIEVCRKKRKEVLAVETRNQRIEKLREQNEELSIVSKNEDKRQNTEEVMELPCLEKGSDRNDFIQEIKSDINLGTCRELADRKQRGYWWEEGILLHAETDDALDRVIEIIVAPKSRRMKILQVAHDRLGHLRTKKVIKIIRKRFTWSLMSKDVGKYCESCPECQRMNKHGQKRVPMVERVTITEPFEQVALDLVGHMPIAKGGYRFILTSVCMASKWPDAVALKSVTAKAVAEAAMEIFCRTSLPLQILTDRGAQFTSKLMQGLCDILSIERIRTTAYHPQTNGVLERLHGTLESILGKAHVKGLDWVKQLPYALFALRQAPNRDTHLSPYELVFGRLARTPLDILYRGWRDVDDGELQVSDWVDNLCEHLEVLRNVAYSRATKASRKRKEAYDKGKVDRQLEVGSLVLTRIPGLGSKLEDSWEGPWEVVKKLSSVNYRIKSLAKARKQKVVHINNVKRYVEKEECVQALTVVAEEVQEDSKVKLRVEKCEGFNEEELEGVLVESKEILVDNPGETGVVMMDIELEPGTRVISQRPYRIPEKMKEGVRKEIEDMLEGGIIEESESAWSFPIVPVLKPNGAVRVCVDYRKLNACTPQTQCYIPTLDDILDDVGQAKVLSKLDLTKGFYQVRLASRAKDLTIFISPFGKYRFKRMPFGLKNAPAVFQALMEKVLASCKGFARVYIDDVLVYSDSWEEHMNHITKVLSALCAAGLTAKPAKCQWRQKYLDYLGHRVGGGQLCVPE